MSEKINFLDNLDNNTQPIFAYREIPNPKFRKIKRAFFYLILFFSVFIATFSITAIFSNDSRFFAKEFINNIKKLNLFGQLPELFHSDAEKIKGYQDDRINILLLGIGGEGHEGPLLSDTMILASYQPSTNKLAMLSIPRDLLVETKDFGRRKINNVHALAEVKNGNGSQAAAQTISQIFNIPIHYYIRIDFKIFQRLVDDLGGVDINIDRSFTDYNYPAPNYAFQTITFKSGLQHLNGQQALKYSRSRHGNNNEGSDFARSRRQQKLISALIKQIVSLDTLLNPKKINNLLSAYLENVQTNVELWEIWALRSKINNFNEKIINQVLDTSPDNYLYEDTVNGAYVLQPKAGDWSDLQYLAANIFNPSLTAKEEAKIEILNSTTIPDLAANTGAVLQNFGYNIRGLQNSPDKNYTQTVIYDLSNGANPKTLNGLKSRLGSLVSSVIPVWLEKTPTNSNDKSNPNIIKTNADIIIIAGTDIVNDINRQLVKMIKIKEIKKTSDQKPELLKSATLTPASNSTPITQ